MSNHTENPKVTSPDPGIALPKIVRVTAVTLVAYGLAMFIFGIFLPFLVYRNAKGFDFIGVPLWILIGLVIILISLSLFEGGYWLLYGNMKGVQVGRKGIYWTLPVGLYAVAIILLNKPLVWVRASGEGYGTNWGGIIFAFLYFILNIILVWGLNSSAKIIGKQRHN